MRVDGGQDGLDVPWRKDDEQSWERELTRKAPARMLVSPQLFEELGGRDRLESYGWNVRLPDPRISGTDSRSVVLTKTRWSVLRSRGKALLTRLIGHA